MKSLARHVVGFAFLGLNLIAGGCGLSDADPDICDDIGTRQDALWPCDKGESWHIEYFIDANLSQWVGAYDCNCEGQLTLFGRRTNYMSTTAYPTQCG